MNSDLWTDSPVFGYGQRSIRLRSKSERRRIDRYNKLLARLVGEELGRDISNWQEIRFVPSEINIITRFGMASYTWWKSGYCGQPLDGSTLIDPKFQPVFQNLSTDDKAVIASAQSLICDLEK